MDIGSRIKKARAYQKMTQAELAQKSGIAVITLSQYERGKRQPRIDQLKKLSEALEVPLSCFTNEKSDFEVDFWMSKAGKRTREDLENDLKKDLHLLEQLELKQNPSYFAKFVNSNAWLISLLSSLSVAIEVDEDGSMWISRDGNFSPCSAEDLDGLQSCIMLNTVSYLNKTFFLDIPDPSDLNEGD